MNTPQPPRSDNEQPSEAQAAFTPEERRHRQMLEMATTLLPAQMSGGERLLPYFYILIETSWIAVLLTGLAMLQFSQSHTPLVPLWSPFVVMAGAYWLVTRLEQREINSEASQQIKDRPAGSALLPVVLVVAVLLIVWASVYSSSLFVLDPRWLGALLNDVLLLDGNAVYVAFICIITLFFCWRGIRLARRVIEPTSVFRALLTGTSVILAVVFFLTVGRVNLTEVSSLLFIIPLFVASGLTAHALAQAAFLRRTYPVGLQGNIAAQERAILNITLMIGLALLVTAFIVGTIASPGFLSTLQQAFAPLGYAYDRFVEFLAQIITFLLTPLFWLFSQMHLQTRLPQIPQFLQQRIKPSQQKLAKTPPAVAAAIPIIKVLLPLLLILAMATLIYLALRRRRVRLIRRDQDTHESIWSWSLFWGQIKALLRTFWRHFFPQRATSPAADEVSILTGEPRTRTIREIYRAFLVWVASRGYPRKRYETPHEFQTRLEEHLPLVEDELDTLTTAYANVRYGAEVPDEAEVARIRAIWNTLQQKQRSVTTAPD